MTINEADFMRSVWPQLRLLHQAGAETNPSKFYGDYRKQSDVGAEELVREYGGRNLRIARVAVLVGSVLPKPPKRDFELRDGPNVFVRDERGEEQMIRLVGGMLEHDGYLRVTSYHLCPEQRVPKPHVAH